MYTTRKWKKIAVANKIEKEKEIDYDERKTELKVQDIA